MGYNIKNTSCSEHDCLFDYVNGGFLAGMGILGFFMSTAVTLCFIFDIIKLSKPKKMFMINIAVNDALIGLIAMIRGLGIISNKVVGANNDGSTNEWCYIFLFIAHFVWGSIILTQIPLTIDWFIALIFPHKYSSFITVKVSVILNVFSWMPMAATHLMWDPIEFARGRRNILFQKEYNRCILGPIPWIPIVTLVAPLTVIFIMYSVIAISIYKNGLSVSRLLATTSAVIFTGFLVTIPQLFLFTLSYPMTYEVGQIFTVTLYHANCVVNPVIYFMANPKIWRQIRKFSKKQNSVGTSG